MKLGKAVVKSRFVILILAVALMIPSLLYTLVSITYIEHKSYICDGIYKG